MSKERPEYVRCVADTHAERQGLSWCGRRVEGEWHFVDVDHAALNGRNEGRLIVCPECLSVLITALAHGQIWSAEYSGDVDVASPIR